MSNPVEKNASPNWQENKYVNSNLNYSSDLKNIWEIGKAYFTSKRKASLPQKQIPINKITESDIINEKHDVAYRLGHSSILIKISDKIILTDPVFSERASPLSFFGPRRFHNTPISIADLPKIDAVIISHDHYDHLDKKAIQALDKKVSHYLVPLGLSKTLESWGVSSNKVSELDWWQSREVDGIEITATPAQHFSGRGLFDRDKTLWASWVIRGSNSNLFFSGDSGYFEGFKEIGDRFGPFDLTMIETGAYNELWSEIHMLPEQSVQAHIDLKGRAMLPIHNSTFDLALHDWYEPFERSTSAAKKHYVNLLTPTIGERINIQSPGKFHAWWREQIEQEFDEAPADAQIAFDQTSLINNY